MTRVITRTQEEKLEHVRALIKKYSEHLENVSKLVESGIQFMDEPEMAVFLQVSLLLVPEETNQEGGELVVITFLLFYVHLIWIYFTNQNISLLCAYFPLCLKNFMSIYLRDHDIA